jgi:hypothetical protein
MTLKNEPTATGGSFQAVTRLTAVEMPARLIIRKKCCHNEKNPEMIARGIFLGSESYHSVYLDCE